MCGVRTSGVTIFFRNGSFVTLAGARPHWYRPCVSLTGEAELVRVCRSPGPERDAAERELCRRYSAKVLRYAERHLRDPNAARDLCQLALLSVIEALRDGRIEDPSRLGAFVLSTCRYLVWDENRAAARERKLSE